MDDDKSLPSFYPPIWPDSSMEALCERLGINSDALKFPRPGKHDSSMSPALIPLTQNMFIWARIGQELAKNEPEFRGNRKKRGRPKSTTGGVDYERHMTLLRHFREQGEKLGSSISYADAINKGMNLGLPGFEDVSIDSYIASVSRGKAVWEKAGKELIQLKVQSLKLQCEVIRKRKQWLDDRRVDVARLQKLNNSRGGLNQLLEMAELRHRLLNPTLSVGKML